jgi:hypothetical protein
VIYDFAAKIYNISNTEMLDMQKLHALVAEMHQTQEPALELKIMLPGDLDSSDVLVKSQTSVASMAPLHDKELEAAIESFQAYLEKIESALEGEINKNSCFYNNSKVFKRLYG